MNTVTKISRNNTRGKIASAISMIVLLLMLTCMNQFLYGFSEKASAGYVWNGDDEDPGPNYPNSPAGPDEKTPDAPVSINEELMHFHESHESPFWSNSLFEHMIHEADKLTVVHFEILSPPPNA